MPVWIKRSFFNLWRRPFRTALVALFLALAVGVFTVMATVNRLAAERFAELEGKLETLVDVRPLGSLALGGKRSKPLPFAASGEIRALGPDLRVEPYLIGREFAGESTVFFVGVPPGAPLRAVGDLESMDRRLVAGRSFKPEEAKARVDVIGLDIAAKENIPAGSIGGGATIKIRGEDWRVVGMFDGGSGFTNGQIFLPFETMRSAFDAQGVSRILVTAPSASRASQVADILSTKLAGQADVVTNRPAIELAQQSLAGIAGATRTGSVLFLVAGALVVMGAMVLAFRDQYREIGVQKALGASNAMIASQLLTESVFLSSLGGLGGIAVAWFGLRVYGRSWTSIKFDLVQAPLSGLSIGIILLACLLLGALGSLYPIVRGRRLDPIAILREE
jgi:putative ABC transport system permease protein